MFIIHHEALQFLEGPTFFLLASGNSKVLLAEKRNRAYNKWEREREMVQENYTVDFKQQEKVAEQRDSRFM